MKRLTLVILAAGGSRRLGRPKALVEVAGVSLLEHAVRRASRVAVKLARAADGAEGAAAAAVMVITRPGLPLPWAARWPEVVIRVNPEPDRGLGSSIRIAAAACGTADGCLFLLVDQYAVQPPHLLALARLWLADARQAVATDLGPEAGVGVPALVPRSLFPELLALDDRQGAKALLANTPNLRGVPCPEARLDVDEPGDLDGLAAWALANPHAFKL